MSKNAEQWSGHEVRHLILIISIFIAACIETDIYLPAFPDMMAHFQVSEAKIQSILTWNFMGLCISSLLYGPLSDAYGRKKPLQIALGLFFLGSLMTVFSRDLNWLLVGRVLQGLGSGGCFSLGSAIIFDVFSQARALQALNQLNLIMPIIMATAPLAGGALNQHFGFRSNFLAVTILVFLSGAYCVATFQETLPPQDQKPLQVRSMLQEFLRVSKSFAFWQMNLVVCLLFSVYLSFLSISSVFFVIELGVPKTHFPYYQGSILLGWMVASIVGIQLMKSWGARNTKYLGIGILMIGMVGVVVSALAAPRDPFWMTLFMVIFSFGFNWVQTPYFGEIMGLMPDIKGLIGSVVTCSRLLLASLVVDLVAHFYDRSIASFTWVAGAVFLVVSTMILLREYSMRGQVQDI